jgi:hypothetical protein
MGGCLATFERTIPLRSVVGDGGNNSGYRVGWKRLNDAHVR